MSLAFGQQWRMLMLAQIVLMQSEIFIPFDLINECYSASCNDPVRIDRSDL